MTRQEYTNKFFPIAKKVTAKTKIYPQTILAMAIVESQAKNENGIFEPGRNAAAKYANNHFGIKADTNYKGKKVLLNTPGDADKKSYFRYYNTIADSYKDYINFLTKNPRYKNAGVFEAPNYQEQIIKIAAAGYAENKNYSDVVINVANSVNKLLQNIKPSLEPIYKTIAALSLLVLTIKSFSNE
jgi:flagellum-specific peptidoglycan hydrolase FlgJ